MACTKRKLLSLTGQLHYAASVAKSSHTFLRQLIARYTTAKRLSHHICLSQLPHFDTVIMVACIYGHLKCCQPSPSVSAPTLHQNPTHPGREVVQPYGTICGSKRMHYGNQPISPPKASKVSWKILQLA